MIDPNNSSVKLLGSKVEINLRKAEPGKWPLLEMPKEPSKVNNGDNSDQKDGVE